MKNTHVPIGLIAIIYLIIPAPAGAQSGKDKPEWMKKYNNRETREKFASPPMFYAPHMFWFWDDVIRDEQLAASMVEEMVKQRFNPGYPHGRSSFHGEVTALPREQYLAEPWFNSFGNAMRKAKENGVTLGYCDDYNWPSGQAAGRVLELHPELEAKHLDFKRYEVTGKSVVTYDSVDFAVAGRLVDKQIDASSLRIIGTGNRIKWNVPKGDWVVYTYTKKFHPGIDGGRVNYLDPKQMDVFIPLVHEQYEKNFSREMGQTIPGVFVDNEGDYGWRMAWSDYFAEQYQEKKKRDIRLWLPLLTEPDKDGLFVKARYDWFDVVSDVYNESYMIPLVEWLKERNMYYISNLWEESLLLQTAGVGDLMRTTRHITMPGNDCLEMKSQEVHDFKEVQSVAEFEDRPFMSEIMGVAGWIQTPEMMKMSINSVTSFGVNHVVPHGVYMNRQLETVPFPTDWYTDNPYWDYLHYWTDFARRAAFVTRQSQLVADVLLVNPLESVWAFSDGYFLGDMHFGNSGSHWDTRAVEVDRMYTEAMIKMNQENIDFLIADNYYLNKGTIQAANNHTKITINDHDFRAIVLPSTPIIPQSSLTKILEFARKGGIVLLLGDIPHGSPEKGLNDKTVIEQGKALKQLPNVIDLSSAPDQMQAMVTTIREKTQPQIRLKDAGRLFTAHRKTATTDLYWFANNTDTVKHFTAWLRDGSGAAEIWNCETGEIIPIASEKENNYRKVFLTLQPYEAYWLGLNAEKKDIKESRQPAQIKKEKILDTKWILHYPKTDTVFKTTAKVLFTNDRVVDPLKLQTSYDDSGWKYYAKQSPEDSKYVYWRMNIPVGAKSVILPAYLVGKEIWLDNQKINVSETFVQLPSRSGLLSYALDVEKEPLQIIPFKFVTGTTTDCDLKSWYTYGLQQYTGFLEYETEIVVEDKASGIAIDLGNVKYMAEVFVNDKPVGARMWPPYKYDLSKEIKPGKNKIRVRVGNLIANDMWMKDDMNKLRTWGWRGTPDLTLVDAGLFGPVKIVYSDTK